jgi:hypothetical protein
MLSGKCSIDVYLLRVLRDSVRPFGAVVSLSFATTGGRINMLPTRFLVRVCFFRLRRCIFGNIVGLWAGLFGNDTHMDGARVDVILCMDLFGTFGRKDNMMER